MIAVDAMGGDRAPRIVVLGALSAARQGIGVKLFGDKSQIIPILDSTYSSWRKLPLSIEHCSDSISMFEEPSRAVLKKKDSSLVKAAQAVAQGQADAIVSAGNSGAMLAAGIFIVGRVQGLERPAIGQFIPTKSDSVFCLDLGANADCKAHYLEQFAVLGSQYVKLIKQIKQPRVALLSNGVEPYKGSLVVKEAYDRLKQCSSILFVGNLESRDMFDDHADVLVSDGFTGNIMLKAVEGTANAVAYWLKLEQRKSWVYALLLLLVSPLFKTLKRKTDYARAGGALLLGVKKPMIISHGSSDERSIMNAIRFAHQVVKDQTVITFNNNVERELMQSVSGARKVVEKVKSIFRN